MASPLDHYDLIDNAPRYPVKGEPLDHQYRALAEAGLKPGHCYWMDPGAGKAQPLTAKICTPYGWVEMGSLKVGDEVIGSNGKPTKVTGVYPQGKRAAYRVTVSGGASTICCDEHLWAFTTHGSHEVKVAPLYWMVRQGIRKSSGSARYILPTVEPVQFEESHIPLDPYALGALIGDGALTSSTISLSVPPHKKAVAQRVAAAMPKGIITKRDAYEGATPRMLFTCGARGSKSNALSKILTELELRGLKSPERFVPDIYKYGSVQQRLDLLRGLMDTNGSCHLNRSRFHTMSPQLADDVIEVVRSLGGAARANASGRDGEITLSIKMAINPFWSRSSDWSLAVNQHLIQSVEYVGEMEMQCISVAAPDRLYVTDDYIVTHNTFTTIAEAGLLWEQGKIDGMLIVAPNGPHIQWIEEQFPMWADFDFMTVHNKQTPRVQKVFFRVKRRHGLAVAAVNYEALGSGKAGKNFVGAFCEMYPRYMLVIDESQKIKDPKSNRSKVIKALADEATYRRALSGTPLLNGLQDLFWQYQCVEPGITGFRSFTAFKSHYCIQRPIPGARSRFAMQIVGFRNEDELQERTRPYATRIKADEFMIGTKPTFSKVWVPMEGKEWIDAYNSMKEDFLLELERDEVAVDNALSQLQKLMQLSAGFIYDEAGEPIWFSTERLERAVELVEGLREPAILWTPYKAQAAALREAVHQIDRPVFGKDNVEQWKETPEGVLLGYQGSGLGVGMNLQHSAAALYLGNTYSAEHRWQSIKRIDRIGQTRQVRIWDFVTPGTVETKCLDALDHKEGLAIRNVDTLRRLVS